MTGEKRRANICFVLKKKHIRSCKIRKRGPISTLAFKIGHATQFLLNIISIEGSYVMVTLTESSLIYYQWRVLFYCFQVCYLKSANYISNAVLF
jgi:hypothetical protein